MNLLQQYCVLKRSRQSTDYQFCIPMVALITHSSELHHSSELPKAVHHNYGEKWLVPSMRDMSRWHAQVRPPAQILPPQTGPSFVNKGCWWGGAIESWLNAQIASMRMQIVIYIVVWMLTGCTSYWRAYFRITPGNGLLVFWKIFMARKRVWTW